VDALLPTVWDPRSYAFWLVVVSLAVAALERLRPWRRRQRVLRSQIGQDLVWLFFNGHVAGVLVAFAAARAFAWAAPGLERLEAVRLVASQPFWIQVVVFFVLKDLLEWGVHNLLHRVPWLWELHKVHHSIEELDWIGNFCFHWMEIVVYRGLTYLPLVVLGVEGGVILSIAVLSTLIGHLNHSNLDVTWGPLRYVRNSPRMHVWHHDRDWPAERPSGVNFGISLSLWDWLFGTAWWPDERERPEQQPARLGFAGMERYPRTWIDRAAHPLSRIWRRGAAGSTRRRPRA
jgi:sterol desaturase/sphingolipid hydroxylase (fatty acid hydroxylase superfamily)